MQPVSTGDRYWQNKDNGIPACKQNAPSHLGSILLQGKKITIYYAASFYRAKILGVGTKNTNTVKVSTNLAILKHSQLLRIYSKYVHLKTLNFEMKIMHICFSVFPLTSTCSWPALLFLSAHLEVLHVWVNLSTDTAKDVCLPISSKSNSIAKEKR